MDDSAEGFGFEELPEAFSLVLALLLSDGDVDGADVVAGPEQLLQEHFAEETGGAGDEHVLLREETGDSALLGHRYLWFVCFEEMMRVISVLWN